MGFGLGKDAKVYVDGYDLTAYFNQADWSLGQEVYESTTFGDSSKEYQPGLGDGTLSLAGFFDAATNAADAVLAAAIGASSDGHWLIYPQGDAIGSYGVGAQVIESNYQTSVPIGGLVTAAAQAQADGGLDRLRSLHALGAETATGASASADHGAATTNGGVGFLIATAFSGTSVVVKIQHSADNSVWADLVTFAAVDAARDRERVVVAAGTTVNRYLREQRASGTFTSVTHHVGFARR